MFKQSTFLQLKTLSSLNNLNTSRSLYTSVLKSDINITKNGKTNISVGQGGRSSRTGYTATVFGASGFLGRYVTSKLARHGTITIVPFRDQMKSRFLKVTGDLGVVNLVEFDLRNIKSIEDSIKHSDIVFNCIGADYHTKNFSMADINIEAARRIAKITKDYEVPRLVHVSSYNADPDSSSVFYATKGIGEAAVREEYPNATIVRPSPMFGREDKILRHWGNKATIFNFNSNKTKIYPTHVLDVAKALELIGFDDSTEGQLYELYGNTEYSLDEIRKIIEPFTKQKYINIDIPKPIALLMTNYLQYIYWKTTNPDQVERAYIDQIIDFRDPNIKTYNDLGIVPDTLTDHVLKYTKQFRTYLHSHDLPPSEKELKNLRKYAHVIEN
ncbi:complex I NDUFA9 subunit family protein [Ascoidea rubescens DSM 1968]|uniref:NAD(P)-binding protein n=1 Tax=Ascoidea rubescens DSM 1968 TaxID=1344418 RepID=A0A1D2VMK7_9ASCO|nr:NAD(P)-binding protein [Ascoidea rubescens DSM 1968]ODV62842.1 NAD(P)-binding protein [Ascoidea rubescens DSM 1968]